MGSDYITHSMSALLFRVVISLLPYALRLVSERSLIESFAADWHSFRLSFPAIKKVIQYTSLCKGTILYAVGGLIL